MGSMPWKRAQMDRWEDDLAGAEVLVRKPGAIYGDDGSPVRPRPTEFGGLLSGSGSRDGRPCVWIVHDGYTHAVLVERGMTIEKAS